MCKVIQNAHSQWGYEIVLRLCKLRFGLDIWWFWVPTIPGPKIKTRHFKPSWQQLRNKLGVLKAPSWQVRIFKMNQVFEHTARYRFPVERKKHGSTYVITRDPTAIFTLQAFNWDNFPRWFKVTMRSNEAWLLIHTFAIARFMCKAFDGVHHWQSIIDTGSPSLQQFLVASEVPHLPWDFEDSGVPNGSSFTRKIHHQPADPRGNNQPADLFYLPENHHNICQGPCKVEVVGLKPPQIAGVTRDVIITTCKWTNGDPEQIQAKFNKPSKIIFSWYWHQKMT